MRTPIQRKTIFWVPRILAILLILLLITYAWGEVDKVYYEFGKLVGALARKMITPLVMTVLLIVSWEYLIFGGILNILFGILYFTFMWDVSYEPWAQISVGAFQFFAGIMYIIGYERPMDTYD